MKNIFKSIQPQTLLARGLVFAGLSMMVACDPVPRRELTAEEKQADMLWLYSKFGENYAPMKYKEELHGFNYQDLKEDYLARAAETENNDEFYALIHEFVANFRDAHTGATLTVSMREGRTELAYLGFTGRRSGDVFEVTEMAPTQGSDSAYPIAVGTQITKIDGLPLKEYVDQKATRYLSLGQPEADYTIHMSGRLVTRVSTRTALPTEDDVTLTIKDGDNEVDVVVPWIKKDVYSYVRDMEAAESSATASVEESEEETPSFINIDGKQLPFALLDFTGRAIDFAKQSTKSAKTFLDRIDTFKVNTPVASWTMDTSTVANFNGLKGSAMLDALKKKRSVPDTAIAVPSASVWPAYIWQETIDEKRVWMGYVNIYSFSIFGDGVSDLKKTLAFFEKFGVEDIVVDTINNGGGSLGLLMQLAQAFSSEKVEQAKIQFGTNEGWIDSLESYKESAPSDAEKALAARLYEEVMAAEDAGLGITPKDTAYSFDVLAPWFVKPNTDLKTKFNIALLVNEMCASSCDIFAATLQDNEMATLVGQTTMGAGGNVVSYYQAPNSNMDISQTESLIVRQNGEYIENVGVTPEVKLTVSEFAGTLYEEVRAKGVEVLSERHKDPDSEDESEEEESTEDTEQQVIAFDV